MPSAWSQARPYLGYAYPAGGQQGTTFQIKVGGQGLDDVNAALITGQGVTAKIVEYYRRMNPQEMQLLSEQIRDLKRVSTSAVATAKTPAMMMNAENPMMMMSEQAGQKKAAMAGNKEAALKLIARIENRTREYVQTPACAAISSLVFVEVTIAADAAPGARELRLATLRGVSNPLVFHVGQLPEHTRKPMITATIQTLGKEEQALRKRPTNEFEVRVTLPCTVNGQIASGEVNRYRFAARQGQRLVITTQARQLIPYIADAVPGWFQPVLALYDDKGKEVAFDDDYRFKPDPVILFEAPKDGDYVLDVFDSIYRGREDFVYRVTLGELPFLTSVFPLGRRVGATAIPAMKGWNLPEAMLSSPAPDAEPGICSVTARVKGEVSNPLPFAVDALPEGFDKEPNDSPKSAQKVALPVVINGRLDKPDDWDVFQFNGKSNDTVVAEVQARRLDSPLDSVIRLTDANGKLLAFSDDCEDWGTGMNTHHADSYFMARLPADGTYYVHLGDTARAGGPEHAYRLRLSAPQPDFALRVVPSSVSFRGKSTAPLTIYAIRKDGYTGPIKLGLKDPPAGFASFPVSLVGTQTVTRLVLTNSLVATKTPVSLVVTGAAKIKDRDLVHAAVPAEDRMQAFLWRHLVPASDLQVLVFDPAYQPPPKRIAPIHPASAQSTNAVAATNTAVAATTKAATNAPGTNVVGAAAAKPKFTKQQIAGRLRQLKLLYEEGMLTDEFYDEKVAECEAAQ